MNNVVKNTGAAIKAAPVLLWVVFHQDELVSSPAVPTEDVIGITPPAGTGAAPAAQAFTNTATPKTATPMEIRGGKSSSNRTQTTNGLGTESKLAADREIDVTSVTSSGMSDADSDYSKLSENLPARLDNHTELAEKTCELEKL